MSAVIQHYQSEFERAEPLLPWRDAKGWQAWRQSAWSRFAEQGFPSTRHEEWKYTSVAALEKLLLSCAPATPAPLDWASLKDKAVLPEARGRLVFVDGVFQPTLSRVDGLPAGLRMGALSGRSTQDSLKLQGLLEQGQRRTPFTALNAAFVAEGAWVAAEAGVRMEEPLLVLYVATEGQRAMHLANAYEAAEGSAFSVVEQYLGMTDEPYLVNGVTSATLDEGAKISHIKIQQEGARSYHIAALQAVQKRSSQFNSHSFALSGALGRNDIEAILAEPDAAVSMRGLYRVSRRELQDFHTTIRHDSPDCTSDECFKGVLNESGRAVFNGKIRVAPDAQHTLSQQSNHNLLLSDQAEVDTKPQLEIFADDVKCSHGATVGQLDEEQWFYLRSRGLAAEHARALLIEAFALDILTGIDLPVLRDALESLLRKTAHV